MSQNEPAHRITPPALHVLLVDDDALVLRTLARGLSRFELRITTAVGTGEALALLESGLHVDVVAADFIMGGASGLTLLKEIERCWPDVGRLLFTGTVDARLLERAVADGAVHCVLEKPFLGCALFDAVRDAAARVRSPGVGWGLATPVRPSA